MFFLFSPFGIDSFFSRRIEIRFGVPHGRRRRGRLPDLKRAMRLTHDDLVDMMDLLDSDGDGEVSKIEFKGYFLRIHPMSEAAFEEEWSKIDTNGDEQLQLSELCEYYGVDTADVEASVQERHEMSDEKILELLALQGELQKERIAREKRLSTTQRRKSIMRAEGSGRRLGVTLIRLGEESIRARRQSSELLCGHLEEGGGAGEP
jgi:hypothetical protein